MLGRWRIYEATEGCTGMVDPLSATLGAIDPFSVGRNVHGVWNEHMLNRLLLEQEHFSHRERVAVIANHLQTEGRVRQMLYVVGTK